MCLGSTIHCHMAIWARWVFRGIQRPSCTHKHILTSRMKVTIGSILFPEILYHSYIKGSTPLIPAGLPDTETVFFSFGNSREGVSSKLRDMACFISRQQCSATSNCSLSVTETTWRKALSSLTHGPVIRKQFACVWNTDHVLRVSFSIHPYHPPTHRYFCNVHATCKAFLSPSFTWLSRSCST